MKHPVRLTVETGEREMDDGLESVVNLLTVVVVLVLLTVVALSATGAFIVLRVLP